MSDIRAQLSTPVKLGARLSVGAGVNGKDGEDGGYYTPSVDGEGNLSWSANKSDMPSVPPTNIKGPKGDPGKPGQDAPREAVLFTEQTLTPEQQAQVRTNIGVDSGGVEFVTDKTLTLSDDGVLSVNMAHSAEANNTLPITSAAVSTIVGNIEVLLGTI